MKSWINRNIRWLIAASAVLLIMAAVPTTSEAGRRWSGIDPELEINGQQMNVWVYWESEFTCDIEGPINVKIRMPRGADYSFTSESVEKFDCDGDGEFDTELATKTTVEEYRGKTVRVLAKVDAPGEKFRTRLKVIKDDKIARKCKGISNKWFRCGGIRF